MQLIMSFLRFLLMVAILGTCSAAMADSLHFSCIEGTPDIEISKLVLAEAYGRLGMEFTIEELPGLRALQSANDGITDGELFRARGVEEKYRNLIRIQVPINTVDIVVLAKDLSFDVTGWEILKPYRVGVQTGITFIEAALAEVEGIHVDRVKNNFQLLQMLDTDRIDVVVIPKISALAILHDLEARGISILEPPLQSLPLYHYLNKKHEALATELEGVLQKMQDEGLIESIRNEYYMKILSG